MMVMSTKAFCFCNMNYDQDGYGDINSARWHALLHQHCMYLMAGIVMIQTVHSLPKSEGCDNLDRIAMV